MSRRGATSARARNAAWTERVRQGWNSVSFRYRPGGSRADWFGHGESSYERWLAPIMESVRKGAPVLDLGCGAGVPASWILARRFRVTGVDVSDVQVLRARRAVPRARFLRGDMSDVDFPERSFAAVVALYSLFHVPRRRHRTLIRRIGRWLRPHGWFFVIVGAHPRYEGSEDRWMGSTSTMLWSQHGADTYRRILREEGFRIVREEFVPEGDGGHRLFQCRKQGREPRTVSPGSRGVAGSGRRPRGLPRRNPVRRPRGGLGQLPSRSGSSGTPRRNG